MKSVSPSACSLLFGLTMVFAPVLFSAESKFVQGEQEVKYSLSSSPQQRETAIFYALKAEVTKQFRDIKKSFPTANFHFEPFSAISREMTVHVLGRNNAPLFKIRISDISYELVPDKKMRHKTFVSYKTCGQRRVAENKYSQWFSEEEAPGSGSKCSLCKMFHKFFWVRKVADIHFYYSEEEY